MKELPNVEKKIDRIDGQLYQTFVIKVGESNEVQRIEYPLKVEIKIHDILEVIVGASILAVPVAFSEEVWNMSDQLPWLNTLFISGLSLLVLGIFIYIAPIDSNSGCIERSINKSVFHIFPLTVCCWASAHNCR